jgi:hypothetical protein
MLSGSFYKKRVSVCLRFLPVFARETSFRNAHISLSQRGSIVYSIANHCDAAAPALKVLDLRGFMLGQNLSEYCRYAGFASNPVSDIVRIAGEHRPFDALSLQVTHCLAQLRANNNNNNNGARAYPCPQRLCRVNRR